MPGDGTELGTITVDEVYIRVDVPRLFSVRNEAGQRFLAVFVHEDEESDVYLYAPVSADRLSAVRSGAIPLHVAFASPQDGHVYAVTTPFEGDEVDVRRMTADDIPRNWLPSSEARLTLDTPTEEAFTEEALTRR